MVYLNTVGTLKEEVEELWPHVVAVIVKKSVGELTDHVAHLLPQRRAAFIQHRRQQLTADRGLGLLWQLEGIKYVKYSSGEKHQ